MTCAECDQPRPCVNADWPVCCECRGRAGCPECREAAAREADRADYDDQGDPR